MIKHPFHLEQSFLSVTPSVYFIHFMCNVCDSKAQSVLLLLLGNLMHNFMWKKLKLGAVSKWSSRTCWARLSKDTSECSEILPGSERKVKGTLTASWGIYNIQLHLLGAGWFPSLHHTHQFLGPSRWLTECTVKWTHLQVGSLKSW